MSGSRRTHTPELKQEAVQPVGRSSERLSATSRASHLESSAAPLHNENLLWQSHPGRPKRPTWATRAPSHEKSSTSLQHRPTQNRGHDRGATALLDQPAVAHRLPFGMHGDHSIARREMR